MKPEQLHGSLFVTGTFEKWAPGWVIVLCSWAKHFSLTVSLSTQEYKKVPVNCQGSLIKC